MATFRNAVLFLVIMFVAAHAVSADGLTAFSPKDGGTIDPTVDEFTFTSTFDGIVSSCQLLIDGQSTKTINYNDNIKGRTLHYLVPVVDGQHTWSVSCDSGTLILTAPTRSFTAKSPEDSGVTVTASGVFRGSFTHEFKFSNSPSQKPVVIQKLAPGDYISIIYSTASSKVTKNLYVKQLSTKNGVLYLWIEDQKKNEEYYLYQGQNVTVSLGTSSILLSYRGVEYNKATVVAYPVVNAQPAPPAVPEDENATQSEETPAAPPAAEPSAPATETPPPTEPAQPPAQDTTPPVEPPKQGFFQSILSWLSHLFG